MKKKSWLMLASARSHINNKCFKGGNKTHQEQAKDAWNNLSKCEKFIEAIIKKRIFRNKFSDIADSK